MGNGVLVFVAFLGLLVTNCGGGPLAVECSPRTLATCQCADGTVMVRTCSPRGQLEPCMCGADAAAPDATPDMGSNGALDGRDAARDASDDGPVKGLPIAARHLVFDSKGKRLFATVGGLDAVNPNSLVVIDVGTARVTGSIPIGSEPSSLAISDDGTTLWVGIDGAAAIRKVDLTTAPPTAGKMFPLPRLDFGIVAGPMWVLQGSTTAVAVSMQYTSLSPNLAGVAILDDGVPRAEMAPSHTGAARLVRGQPGWLFGFNNLHTGFGFYSLPVTASGVTQEEFTGLAAGFDTDIVYAGGRVFSTTGSVVDVTTPTAPALAGTFPYFGAIAPVPAKNRAYMLSPGVAEMMGKLVGMLRVLDTDRFIQVSATYLPGLDEDLVWDLTQVSDTQLVVLAARSFRDEPPRLVFLSVAPLP